MKQKTLRATIHIWGLAWVIGLSFLLIDDTVKASFTVLCLLPVNFIVCNIIFNSIYNNSDKKDKHDS